MKLFILILIFSYAFGRGKIGKITDVPKNKITTTNDTIEVLDWNDFYEYDFPNNFEASLLDFRDPPCDNDYHTYLRLSISHITF